MIEPREKFTENLVRHVGVQGQPQAPPVWSRILHTKKSAIELTILEAACQHMGYVCFQSALIRVGRINDR